MLIVKDGDLLKACEQYIVHQCNCISTNSYGLSKNMFIKFPYADCYSKRKKLDRRNFAVEEDRAEPGTIDICGDGIKNRYVINIFGQYGMSKPYTYNNSNKDFNDNFIIRLKWFKKALRKIAKLNPKSIAFPWMIGCGLAGGSWEKDYYPTIKNWSDKNPDIEVILYKLV